MSFELSISAEIVPVYHGNLVVKTKQITSHHRKVETSLKVGSDNIIFDVVENVVGLWLVFQRKSFSR